MRVSFLEVAPHFADESLQWISLVGARRGAFQIHSPLTELLRFTSGLSLRQKSPRICCVRLPQISSSRARWLHLHMVWLACSSSRNFLLPALCCFVGLRRHLASSQSSRSCARRLRHLQAAHLCLVFSFNSTTSCPIIWALLCRLFQLLVCARRAPNLGLDDPLHTND